MHCQVNLYDLKIPHGLLNTSSHQRPCDSYDVRKNAAGCNLRPRSGAFNHQGKHRISVAGNNHDIIRIDKRAEGACGRFFPKRKNCFPFFDSSKKASTLGASKQDAGRIGSIVTASASIRIPHSRARISAFRAASIALRSSRGSGSV